VSTTKPRTSSGTASASQIASPNKRAGRAATCVPACSASCQPPPSVYIRRRHESEHLPTRLHRPNRLAIEANPLSNSASRSSADPCALRRP
jgi:hypothetical protein